MRLHVLVVLLLDPYLAAFFRTEVVGFSKVNYLEIKAVEPLGVRAGFQLAVFHCHSPVKGLPSIIVLLLNEHAMKLCTHDIFMNGVWSFRRVPEVAPFLFPIESIPATPFPSISF